MLVVAWSGLFLMFAQWWALWTVRRWGREIKMMRLRVGRDVEKVGVGSEFIGDEKMRF